MEKRREQGPVTRGSLLQCRRVTRNMRRLSTCTKLKFMCHCCQDPAPGTSEGQLRAVGRFRVKKCKDIDEPKQSKVVKKRRSVARVVRDTKCEKEVSPSKPRGRAPSAACAANSHFTRSGECIHLLPVALANASRSQCVAASSFSSKSTTKDRDPVDGLQQKDKIVVWKNSYSTVSLCDLGSLCVECQQKCSVVLPDNVQSKHCFKEEMRAGFRFEPGCLSQKKRSHHEIDQVQNNGQLSRLDSERNHSQLTCTKKQSQVTNNTDSGALLTHVLQSQKASGLACSDEERPDNFCMKIIQNKCTGSSQNMLGNQLFVNTQPDTLSVDPIIQNGDDMDSPLSDNRFSDTLESVRVDSPMRTEKKPSRPNGLTLDKTDELDSFTCQRVRVYSGKKSSSCARTYLAWPLLSTKPSSSECVENGDMGLSCFQISQPFEPANPNRPPQPNHSISNQGAGANINEITSNSVDASSDLVDKTKKCPLYSSQQTVMIPQIQDTLCKGLAGSSFRRPAPLQIQESSSTMTGSNTPVPSPSTLCLTETGPIIFATTFPEISEVSNSVSRSSSPLTTSEHNSCDVNPSQTAGLGSFDSNDSCDSLSILPQEKKVSWDESVTIHSPPKLKPYFKTIQFICEQTNSHLLLPPLLSPINSPRKHCVSSTSAQCESHNSDMLLSKLQSESHTPEISNVNENIHGHDCCSPPIELFPSCHDAHRSPAEKESQQNTLATDSIAQSPASDISAQSSFSPSSNEKSNSESSSDSDSNSSGESESQELEDLEKPEVLNEVDAYEHDILLVDVFQEDSDLFEKLPQKGLLKLGPVRTSDTPGPGRKNMVKIVAPASESPKITQSITPVNLDFLRNNPEDSPRRSWRPQCNNVSYALQCGSKKQKQCKIMGSFEEQLLHPGQERTVHFPSENMSHISPSLASRLGFTTRTTSALNTADVRWQKPAYCRNYFSESLNCGFKECRFHHLPMDGDEKFCTETVARFVKNPACLHKAGAVITGFYQSNKPGVYFSMPVLVTLLRALLRAGMLPDLFSVLRTFTDHNILPEHELLLELFNVIREKGFLNFAPELMQLILKMADAGLPLSLDCLDCVKNTELHNTISSDSARVLSGNTRSTPEGLNLACAVVEMELCTKQEEWKRLGKVFQSICQSAQVNQVEKISGRITVALLSESKDRLTLPFVVFAETAAHNVDENSPVKNYLGRIGVSLLLRYHKNHQWAKGLKVVETLSAEKLSFTTMKGLFGNEDRTSRCHLINVTAELFLFNNSVEGALKTLRENEWFLTSSSWPCEVADIENRIHVLLCLAEMTSHRDTLEILCNLPGMKESNGHVDISRYTAFFTSHLQVCLDRQIVPLASDLVDFMLSKGLQVDRAMLQMLLHKLGKQNLWLRAREVFKHSVNKGYYPGVSAPHGMMALMVPAQLGEIELALTFEMFITYNATAILALPECTTSTLSIILKRTQSDESDYLSAGSRLLSAACIPQPKLIVRYTTVNFSQEQVFALDISSARRWLRNNHLWANEVWTIST